jgi:hypothetical protein
MRERTTSMGTPTQLSAARQLRCSSDILRRLTPVNSRAFYSRTPMTVSCPHQSETKD